MNIVSFFILLFLNAYFPLSTSQTIGHHSDTACIFLYFLNCTLSFRFHYCYYFEHLIFFTSFNKHYILKVFLCVQLILCSFSLLCDAPWCTCNTIFPISSLNKAITPHWFQLFAIKHDFTQSFTKSFTQSFSGGYFASEVRVLMSTPLFIWVWFVVTMGQNYIDRSPSGSPGFNLYSSLSHFSSY